MTQALKQMSSYYQGLKCFVLFSWFRNHNTVQWCSPASAVTYEQLQIAVCENLTNDVCDLGMTEIIDKSRPRPRRSAMQHRWYGTQPHPTIFDFQCISLYGSEYNTTRTTCIHPDYDRGIRWSDAKESRLLKAYRICITKTELHKQSTQMLS